MATKKKTSKKAPGKRAPRKTAAAAEGAEGAEGKPRRKRSGTRKKLAEYVPDVGRIERFMTALIGAGHVGDAIGEDGKERKRQASSLRQMGEALDRQFRKYG